MFRDALLVYPTGHRYCFQPSDTGTTDFVFRTGRGFPSPSRYFPIRLSMTFLFSTWEEKISNRSVSRMVCRVRAARRDFSSSLSASFSLNNTLPALSRSSGVTARETASTAGYVLSSSSCSSFQHSHLLQR